MRFEEPAPDAGARAMKPTMGDGARGRPHALVVETNPSLLRLCREALEVLGYAVATADSGIGALIRARKDRPDVIVMDGQLRDVPAREAIGWLRSNPDLRATPILLLTNAGEGIEAHLARPDAALTKPLSPLAIRRALQALMTRSEEEEP